MSFNFIVGALVARGLLIVANPEGLNLTMSRSRTRGNQRPASAILPA